MRATGRPGRARGCSESDRARGRVYRKTPQTEAPGILAAWKPRRAVSAVPRDCAGGVRPLPYRGDTVWPAGPGRASGDQVPAARTLTSVGRQFVDTRATGRAAHRRPGSHRFRHAIAHGTTRPTRSVSPPAHTVRDRHRVRGAPSAVADVGRVEPYVRRAYGNHWRQRPARFSNHHSAGPRPHGNGPKRERGQRRDLQQ